MDGIPFPGIPNLILSATHLVDLYLHNMPYSSSISPEAMVTCLSVLTCLHTLSLGFLFSQSRSDRKSRRPPSITTILPDLTNIRFQGASEYLEDLVSRIDAPLLQDLLICFPHYTDLDTAHLAQFISRTPRFQKPNGAHVNLDAFAEVQLLFEHDDYRVQISCYNERRLSCITKVCTMCLPPLPTAENLRLGVYPDYLDSEFNWKDDVNDGKLLELLRPFTAVKNLYLSELFQPYMAIALQQLVGGRTTAVLPSLQNIYLEKLDSERSGPFQEAIEAFVAVRQLSGHSIAFLHYNLEN